MKKLFTLFLSIFLINTLLAQTTHLGTSGKENTTLANSGNVANVSDFPCQPFMVQLNEQLLSFPIEDSAYLKVCPSDIITFGAEAIFFDNYNNYIQTQSNTKFIWKLDNTPPDTGTTIMKTLFQPQILNYSLYGIDVNGCPSENVFKGIILVSGNPIISVNPTINAVANTPFYVSAGVQNEATLLFQPIEIQTATFPSNFINYDTVFLPDGNNISYNNDIVIWSFQGNQLLETIDQLKSINLNMEHSYLGDLSIRITCPNGQNALLKSFSEGNPAMTGTVANSCSSGGGGINLGVAIDAGTASECYLTPGVGWDYHFKPGATHCFGTGGPTTSYHYIDQCATTWTGPSLISSVPITDSNIVSAPVFYGSYQDLSSLIGCPLNGNWRITVTDHLTIDNGFIFNWGIEFDESLIPDSMSYTINVDSATWTGQNITPTGPFSATILNSNPEISNYTVTLIDEFGCEYDADFIVNTVLGVNDYDNSISQITFYPNPATNLINGSTSNTNWNNSTIELFDSNGKLLKTFVMKDGSIQIDLSNFAVGQYYIKSTNKNNSSHTVKIVVIR